MPKYHYLIVEGLQLPFANLCLLNATSSCAIYFSRAEQNKMGTSVDKTHKALFGSPVFS
jgi:hypothetical protein